MYKIWKYFEKGQSRVCAYRMYETARICPGFVFSQTRNLVFSSFFQVQIHKFDLVFIGILWTDFTTIYLPFYHLIIHILQILEFIQCLQVFFYKNK